MKRALVLLIAMVMVVGLMGQAQADLVLRGVDSLGNGLIYDTGLNVTWYDYTRSFNSWQGQVNWAQGLSVNYGGQNLTGWRLPTTVNNASSWGYKPNPASSEMAHLYYTELGNIGRPDAGYGLTNTGPFKNLTDGAYWSGTEYYADPDYAWNFVFWNGQNGYTKKYNDSLYWRPYLALAVRPGDVSFNPVPIPGAVWLLGSGIVGLVGARKKLFK